MAFGLGFNKAKVLSAAEKCVMQGKIPAAIAEYSKILNNEPRDLTILNIVGDLYLRINKQDEALKCFYKLGEAYLDDGFTRNAIAVFRRICRVDAGQMDAVLRLAELYTLQGQLGDARAQYQQAIEHYSKRSDSVKCTELMEKLLLLEPDNLLVQQQLAALYLQAKRQPEAAAMYLSVAEKLADRESYLEADKALKQARDAGADGPVATILTGRILMGLGRADEAVATLTALPAEKQDKTVLNILFHAYNGDGDNVRATEIAERLLTEHDDPAGVALLCDRLVEQKKYDEVLNEYEKIADALLSQHAADPLADGLKRVLGAEPSNIRALKLLRQVYTRTEQMGELLSVNEKLAAAAERNGDRELALEIYTDLARLEPQNEHYSARLVALRGDQHVEPASGDSGLGEEFLAAAPAPQVQEPTLSATISERLKDAFNESDLYLTYKQLDKAIQPLEGMLVQLPTRIAVNERLLELYQRGGMLKKAAERADVLATVYRAAGDTEKSAEYEQMSMRFAAGAQAAADGGAAAAPREFTEFGFGSPVTELGSSASPAAAAPAAEPAPPVPALGESTVREVDLSEWETMLHTEAPATPAAPVESGLQADVARIEALLAAGQVSDAFTALADMQERYAGTSELEAVSEKVAMASVSMSSTETPAAPEPEAVPSPETLEVTPVDFTFESAGGEQPGTMREVQFGLEPAPPPAFDVQPAPETTALVPEPAPAGEPSAESVTEPVVQETVAVVEPDAIVEPVAQEPAVVEPVAAVEPEPAAEFVAEAPKPFVPTAPDEQAAVAAGEPPIAVEEPGALTEAPSVAPAHPELELVSQADSGPAGEDTFELSLELEEEPKAALPPPVEITASPASAVPQADRTVSAPAAAMAASALVGAAPVAVTAPPPPAPPSTPQATASVSPAAPSAAPSAAAALGGFDSLVGALEDELSDVPAAPAPPPLAARPPATPPQHGRGTTPASPGKGAAALSDMFAEFKEGIEEPVSTGEDFDTHFNMGVAFKEMQLYDEAIGEFQRAYQVAERTRNFANYVQCCTLLAHCFKEKGLPALAVRWLENALKAPGLDTEGILALRYEIATAHEAAGNNKAALDSYMEVYAMNIDYRDVADRIRELRGK